MHTGDGSVQPDFVLMSTWHDEESLEHALWFFTSCAFPLDTEIETTSYLAVTLGRADWAETVEQALSKVHEF
jgi:hypothetical protein